MLLTSLFTGKKRKVIQIFPNGDVLCEEPENVSGETIVSKNNIGPIEYEIGDKVKIVKDWKDFETFSDTDSCVGKIGIVVDALPNVTPPSYRVQGDNFAWWYWDDDLCPAEMNIPKKKLPRVIN